jgi:hypothetical protein
MSKSPFILAWRYRRLYTWSHRIWHDAGDTQALNEEGDVFPYRVTAG